MVLHTYDHGTWEVEGRDQEIKASLGHRARLRSARVIPNKTMKNPNIHILYKTACITCNWINHLFAEKRHNANIALDLKYINIYRACSWMFENIIPGKSSKCTHIKFGS